MTKSQANKILYKIYRMLDEISMQFRLNRKLVEHGITACWDNDPSKGSLIAINSEKSEFMGSVIHECLHLLDWEMSETKVVKLEKALMRKLTDRQLLNLLKKIIMHHTKR